MTRGKRCWKLEAMFHRLAPSAAAPANRERAKQKGKKGETR